MYKSHDLLHLWIVRSGNEHRYVSFLPILTVLCHSRLAYSCESRNILVFCGQQQQQQWSITLSFAHAHGVNIVLYCLAVIKVHDVCTYKHPSHVHTYHHSALVWVTDAHWAHHISVTAVQSMTLNKLINGSLHVALLRIFVLYITGVSVKVYKMRISTAVIIYGSAFCLPLSHYHQ